MLNREVLLGIGSVSLSLGWAVMCVIFLNVLSLGYFEAFAEQSFLVVFLAWFFQSSMVRVLWLLGRASISLPTISVLLFVAFHVLARSLTLPAHISETQALLGLYMLLVLNTWIVVDFIYLLASIFSLSEEYRLSKSASTTEKTIPETENSAK